MAGKASLVVFSVRLLLTAKRERGRERRRERGKGGKKEKCSYARVSKELDREGDAALSRRFNLFPLPFQPQTTTKEKKKSQSWRGRERERASVCEAMCAAEGQKGEGCIEPVEEHKALSFPSVLTRNGGKEKREGHTQTHSRILASTQPRRGARRMYKGFRF